MCDNDEKKHMAGGETAWGCYSKVSYELPPQKTILRKGGLRIDESKKKSIGKPK